MVYILTVVCCEVLFSSRRVSWSGKPKFLSQAGPPGLRKYFDGGGGGIEKITMGEVLSDFQGGGLPFIFPGVTSLQFSKGTSPPPKNIRYKFVDLYLPNKRKHHSI